MGDTIFATAIVTYESYIKKGYPMIIVLNDKTIFDGNVTELKKVFTIKQWAKLCQYKCISHEFNRTFETLRFVLIGKELSEVKS